MWHDTDELARRLMGGDPMVLEYLRVNVWPAVGRGLQCRFAGQLRASDMDDVLQETLLAMWRNREKYGGAYGSVPSWFAGIARNVASDFARRGWVRQRQQERGLDEMRTASQSRRDDSAGEMAPRDAGREVVLLRACLTNLSCRQRQILFACLASNGDRPTSGRLAAELGSTSAMVRKELSRAVASIRETFTEAVGAPSGGTSDN